VVAIGGVQSVNQKRSRQTTNIGFDRFPLDGRQALGPPARSALPELIADAYRRAAAPLRRRLLEGLLHPVGSLALAAIASGAFSSFLLRCTQGVTPDDVARITAEQLVELSMFTLRARTRSWESNAATSCRSSCREKKPGCLPGSERSSADASLRPAIRSPKEDPRTRYERSHSELMQRGAGIVAMWRAP
jgi:hypothetical protein